MCGERHQIVGYIFKWKHKIVGYLTIELWIKHCQKKLLKEKYKLVDKSKSMLVSMRSNLALYPRIARC